MVNTNNIDYNDLLVPTGMRSTARGILLGILGADMGSEFMYLKTLFKGTVDFITIDINKFALDLSIVTKLKQHIKEDNIDTKNFNELHLTDDANLNISLLRGMEKYLKFRNIVSVKVEYNNLLKLLMYFTQTYSELNSRILNNKVVYYGNVNNDMLEYFNFLNFIGIDVIYLSLNLSNVDLISKYTNSIKVVGESKDDTTTLDEILNKTNSFKTRTQDAVDKHIDNISTYKTIIRRLNNSIYDFDTLYDVKAEFREYYEKDEVNKIIHLPTYFCNLIGYKGEEFNNVVNTIFKASNTHYINSLNNILVQLSTQEFSLMGLAIDFSNLSVDVTSNSFKGYNKYYLDTLLKLVAEVMEELKLSIVNSKNKRVLVTVFYSLVKLGVNIDINSITTKYIINNYKDLLLDNTFRVMLNSLNKLGSDIVVLSASEELEGFHNIQLGCKVYNKEGSNGITSLGNLIDTTYRDRNKKKGNFFSRLLNL